MSTPRYLLVLIRDDRTPTLSAAALGIMTGRLVAWVAALRRWRLLHAVAVGGDSGPVRACVLVTATDLAAARGLAASCPAPVLVLPILGEAG
jgi:hypothetical protein